MWRAYNLVLMEICKRRQNSARDASQANRQLIPLGKPHRLQLTPADENYTKLSLTAGFMMVECHPRRVYPPTTLTHLHKAVEMTGTPALRRRSRETPLKVGYVSARKLFKSHTMPDRLGKEKVQKATVEMPWHLTLTLSKNQSC